MIKRIVFFCCSFFVMIAFFGLAGWQNQVVFASSLTKVRDLQIIKKEERLIIISWRRVTTAKKYQIYLLDENKVLIKKMFSQKTKKNIKNLTPATTYYLKIRAVNKKQHGSFSKLLRVKTKAAEESDDGNTDAGEEVQTYDIDISNFAFNPDSLTIIVGDTVRWTNNDSVGHTATQTNGTFNSGTLTSGETFTYTFAQAGSYTYYCALHPSMTATISVQ